MINVRTKEYGRLAYAVNNLNGPITRKKVLDIVRCISYAGQTFGYIPSNIIRKTMMPEEENDVLEFRVNNALDWAIEDGVLMTDLNNPNLILPNLYKNL